MKLCYLFLIIKFVHIKGQEDYAANPGHRLVAATRISAFEAPFLVGLQFPQVLGGCTGSLIARKWVLTASHCITQFYGKASKCLENTRLQGNHSHMAWGSTPLTVKCTRNTEESIKIEVLAPAHQFAVMHSTENMREPDRMVEADYMVRHNYGYRGRKHGYIGYDIALVHLVQPILTFFACLPAPSFQDSGLGETFGTEGAILAGYGDYLRNQTHACLTDEYGESKYHYCNHVSECEENIGLPPPMPSICQQFFSDFTTPDEVPANLTEIVVTDEDTVAYCTRQSSPKPGSRGWCMVDDNVAGIGRYFEDRSWGFCSSECFLEETSLDSNSLRRREGAEILTDELCDLYLDWALDQVKEYMGVETTEKPQILCIGKIELLKYEQWNSTGFGFSKSKRKTVNHKMAALEGANHFVRSVGTCKGDSGGPVYVKREDRFVVLGVVSGGKTGMGSCGGVNNPTHYARVKWFGDWIAESIGADYDQLCWFDQGGEVEGKRKHWQEYLYRLFRG